MGIEELFRGKKLTLYEITQRGKSLIREFLESLGESDRAQMLTLLKYTSDNGPPRNEEKFRNLGDGIYEFKTRNGYRILCFWGISNSIVLTHGFPKPKRKRLITEKQRALAFYREYSRSTDN